MKVLFYTNVPSPYRIDFFNELGRYCELTVLFEVSNSAERDESWKNFQFKNFEGIVLNGIRTHVDGAFCPQIVKYLNNKFDHIVVTQVASLTAIWAVAYMKLRRIKYCYEGDGGFVGKTRGIKAFLKRLIIGNARFCLSTSKAFDEYCIAYGAKRERIYRYPFTSIYEKDLLKYPLNKNEKNLYKKKVEISEDIIILSVGRFIYGKGFDLLLEASRFWGDNVGVYIVGGKATSDYLKMKEEWNLKQVHFVDFMDKERLKMYYRAADIFVFPTRQDAWGLVVNEAMANGLPVVSTQKCVAALEMIREGENGYIVPINDVLKLKDAVERIMESQELCYKMSRKSIETMKKEYTIENMAKEHIKIFEKEKKGNL